jgi:hypothetical protein
MVEKIVHLRVKSRKSEIHKVEALVERVCDDYNVNQSYFGNILFSVCEAFEFAIEQKSDGVDIYFESRPQSLVFKVSLGDHFLEIAALYEKEIDQHLENQNITNKERSAVMIRMLSDEVNFDVQQELMEMVFYISSINQHLTRERIRLLDEYYSRASIKKPV